MAGDGKLDGGQQARWKVDGGGGRHAGERPAATAGELEGRTAVAARELEGISAACGLRRARVAGAGNELWQIGDGEQSKTIREGLGVRLGISFLQRQYIIQQILSKFGYAMEATNDRTRDR
jgi:hypothetical protein